MNGVVNECVTIYAKGMNMKSECMDKNKKNRKEAHKNFGNNIATIY